MRPRLPIVVALALGTVSIATGCLLTSNFDGVVGLRPVEGGVPSEAGEAGEAGPVGDGGAGEAGASPCASGTHLVCSDFDAPGGGFPIPGWNNVAVDGGVLSLDNTTPVTSPLALRVKVDGASGPSAYLYRSTFLGSFTSLIVSFDLRIVACPPQGKSLTLVYVEPSAKASFGLVVLASGVQAVGVGISGAFTFFTLDKQIPDQTWTHVVWRILVKDAATAHLNVTVDGLPSVDTDTSSSVMRNTALLNLGLVGGSAPKGCEVQYDNYVLDKE